MTAKTRRKPNGPMSKREAGNALWGMFEDFVIDGDLFSFTDHAGIKVRGVAPEQVWDVFRRHYECGDDGVDNEKFATDFATWGPIASRTIELQLEKARNAASS